MRGRTDIVAVPRRTLLDRTVGASVVLVEAPGGYGKSSFAAQLAATGDRAHARAVVDGTGDVVGAVRHALARAGAGDLADAVDPDDPGTLAEAWRARDGFALVVDEVQRCTPDSVRWLLGLARSTVRPSVLVIAGRRLGRELAELVADQADTVRVGTDDLRFDHEEAALVLSGVAGATVADLDGRPDPSTVAELMRITAGWPAAVVLAAVRLVARGVPNAVQHVDHAVGADGTGLAGTASLAELLERQLSTASAELRDLVRELAHLPLLSAEVAARVGGDGTLDRVLDLGLPIRFRDDGWGELSDPVREHLTLGHRPAPAVVRAAAEVYARRGEVPAAAQLLAVNSLGAELCDLLLVLPWRSLVAMGLARLDVLVAAIPDDVLASRAALLVRLAVLAERTDPVRRTRWLDRAAALAVDPRHRRALAIERSLDLARKQGVGDAVETMEATRAACGEGEEFTIGRASLGIGLCRIVREQGNASSETIAEFERAAAVFQQIGEVLYEAQALRSVAFGAHFNLGAFELATEQLERAAALLGAPDASRAMLLTYVAEVHRDLGRLDDAESTLHESLAIGRRIGNAVSISYAAWSLACVAGERRDLAGLLRWSEETEASAHGWIDGAASLDYHGQMAEAFLQLGEVDRALVHLERVERHPAALDYVWPARSARARYEATFGDPALAESVLDELDAIAPPRERPLRIQLRAVCRARLGDAVEAARLSAEARRVSAAMGDPDRIERREPELVALVAAHAPADAAAATDSLARRFDPPVSVRVLGGFAVTAGAEVVTPPPGRPSTLVKVLALRGALTVEVAVDLLWEGCDLDTGRARLRNLLNRIRSASGPIVERDGELLRLAAGAEVDATRFEVTAARALGADPAERVGAARAALAVHAGDLLPGDLYEDWAAGPRERVRRRHLALVDLVARDAVARDDLDEAIRLLDVGLEAEPFELWRHVEVARALVRQGRPRAAAAAASRALAVCDDLGVSADPDLVAIAGVGEHP